MKKKKRSRSIEGNTKKGRIWEKTDGHCHLCSERLYEDKWCIDHLVPLVQDGSDEEWNLLPCCVFCNGMKKAAETYKIRRVLMYGRYCLEEATRRDTSEDGKTIYEVVGRKAKSTANRAQRKRKPPHIQLWKQTPKKSRGRW